ncbi:MAG: hypothetical protein ACXU7H_02735, partial [Burkholderiaceae bacterium]
NPSSIGLSDHSIEMLIQACAFMLDSELVFPNRATGEQVSAQAFTKVLLRENLKVTNTAHGFRSTFGTWAVEQIKYSHEVCESAAVFLITTTPRAYF